MWHAWLSSYVPEPHNNYLFFPTVTSSRTLSHVHVIRLPMELQKLETYSYGMDTRDKWQNWVTRPVYVVYCSDGNNLLPLYFIAVGPGTRPGTHQPNWESWISVHFLFSLSLSLAQKERDTYWSGHSVWLMSGKVSMTKLSPREQLIKL